MADCLKLEKATLEAPLAPVAWMLSWASLYSPCVGAMALKKAHTHTRKCDCDLYVVNSVSHAAMCN